jgi:hypothetical protein
VYTQYCPFKDIAKKEEAVIPAPEMRADSASSGAGQTTLTPEQLRALTQQVQFMPEQQMDMYELHGMVKPTAICELCDREFRVHTPGCDQHGWKETSRKVYVLPADWPFYHASTGTWGKKPEHCTSS